MWSRKSNELFYKSILGEIMAVGYRTAGDALVAAKPRPTPVRAANMGAGMAFDLAPDASDLSSRGLRPRWRKARPMSLSC